MEYAPIGGEGDFCQKAAKLAFGEISNVLSKARNVTIQGISGTGVPHYQRRADVQASGNKTIYLTQRSASTELRQEHVLVRREGGGLHRGLHRQGRGRQVSKSQKRLRLLILINT